MATGLERPVVVRIAGVSPTTVGRQIKFNRALHELVVRDRLNTRYPSGASLAFL